MIAIIYVDDFVLAAPQSSIITEFITQFRSAYNLKDLGPLTWFLNIAIERDRTNRSVTLSQAAYIDKIATSFNLQDSPKVLSPLSPNIELLPNSGRATPADTHGYQRRVGSILYAATTTRPDVMFAATQLSRFMQNPSHIHIEQADRVISYLYHTKEYGLHYKFGATPTELQFTTYVDAAYAIDMKQCKSTTGYVFYLDGCPVDWRSMMQRGIATSSTEAKYHALIQAAKDLIVWKRIFCEMHIAVTVFPIRSDNKQAVRALNSTEDQLLNTKLRHIRIRECWLRDQIQQGILQVEWIPGDQQLADGFTKPLCGQKLKAFINALFLQC